MFKLPKLMTEIEIKQFFKTLDTHPYFKKEMYMEKIIYKTIYFCGGLRVSECTNLRLEDINLEEKTLFVNKGKYKKDRYLVIPDSFLPEFKKYYNYIKLKTPRGWLFPSKHRSKKMGFTHIHSRQIGAKMKPILYHAGLDKHYHPHTLRHSTITQIYKWMVRTGHFDPITIKVIAGWTSLNMLIVYAHLNTEHISRVINAVFKKTK